MRHSATLVSAIEGISRPVFHIARELASNSRSGLTVRFLSKKLELPQEEIEYLVDLHHKLFFHDITKVKLVAEGSNSVKRIQEGLENRGDVQSIYEIVKGMSPHDFRLLEEFLGIENPGPKKAAAEQLIDQYYAHPESIVDYVATRGFSPLAQEIFDTVWNSGDGIVPVSKLRAIHDTTEYKIEEALHELFSGCALFEMFRFDEQERLVRVAGLLAELRAWRKGSAKKGKSRKKLKAYRGQPGAVQHGGIQLSDRICRLVAAIAAKPARLRSDGELFREDRRRLQDIVPDEEEPSLDTCLWIAQGVGWLARVDNELHAVDLEPLIDLGRLDRHQKLYDWLASQGTESKARRLMVDLLDNIKTETWYPVTDAITFVMQAKSEGEPPVLQNQGGHWAYVAPGAGAGSQKSLARALEETFFWLGLVERAESDKGALFRVTKLGDAFLTGGTLDLLKKFYPEAHSEIIVQPNFDIVVPIQDTDPLITVPLDQFADRQSTGTAAVYNLTKDSFTRGIQEGHDGQAFINFLLTHNRGGTLPKNVLQTLEDWRGSVKRVRVRTIHVLEADDPLVIADLMHRRRFEKYFNDLDPKKVIPFDRKAKAELTKELEKEGFVIG